MVEVSTEAKTIAFETKFLHLLLAHLFEQTSRATEL